MLLADSFHVAPLIAHQLDRRWRRSSEERRAADGSPFIGIRAASGMTRGGTSIRPACQSTAAGDTMKTELGAIAIRGGRHRGTLPVEHVSDVLR